MLGVPYAWRELNRDAASDPRLHELIRAADIVSPWAVGRYATSGQFAGNIAKYPATAIFKCSNQPPAGETQFLTLDGLPTDHYLRGAGEFGKALKKAVEAH